MAIDELLRQADQNRARQGYGPRTAQPASGIDAGVQDRLAKMRAADTAAAQSAVDQQRLRPAPRTAAAPAAATPATQPAGGSRFGQVIDALTRSRKLPSVGTTAKAVGKVLAPIGIGAGVYANAKDLGDGENVVKAAGGDYGAITPFIAAGNSTISALSGGLIKPETVANAGLRVRALLGDPTAQYEVERLSRAQDKPVSIDAPTANTAGELPNRPEAQGAPAATAAGPSASVSSVRPDRGLPNSPEAQQPAIYRKGNSFSDQAIDGGVQFTPARGGFVQFHSQPGAPTTLDRLNAHLASIQRDRAEALGRRDQANAAAGRTAALISARNAAERDARSARLRAESLVPIGNSARADREARNALLERESQALGRVNQMQVALGEAPYARTPEQELQLEGSKNAAASQDRMSAAQAAVQEQQGIAAGIQNQQAQRQQQVMEQLQNIGNLPPEQRRALIDRALISQGKDPDANAYDIQVLRGEETMEGRRGDTALTFDRRSGVATPVAIPGGAVGNGQQKPQYSEGAIYRSNGQLFIIQNGQPVPYNPQR